MNEEMNQLWTCICAFGPKNFRNFVVFNKKKQDYIMDLIEKYIYLKSATNSPAG